MSIIIIIGISHSVCLFVSQSVRSSADFGFLAPTGALEVGMSDLCLSVHLSVYFRVMGGSRA